MSPDFDIIVVGGGHAGAEAAWAAARLGARTAMVVFDARAIGRMSCNPAIGGIGKGQIVREIDALGGLMGLATDMAGIQFRTLNQRKGPAVQAPRAQCDRELYESAVQQLLRATENLTIIEASAEEIVFERQAPARCRPADVRSTQPTGPQAAGNDSDQARLSSAELCVSGVRLGDGRMLRAGRVIVTTGTFLRAVMHCGPAQSCGGRIGEKSADGLSASLRAAGLLLGRLKTGTPPRLARDSICFEALAAQPGDDPPRPFSYMNDAVSNPQVPCWITYTNEAVHELIRGNLHRAPMYSGQIQARGPRYCPSIEDKVVRFADKPRHQIFLEPEGYTSDRIYCNGISTSLPQDVQEQIVHRIAGLENARVLQWGYAVEYDFVPPHQTLPTLECKAVRGLYLAGQINGTSGYEEAAGQGLLAGINAAQSTAGRDPLILTRDASYIGVMIDDLVTRGVNEPYRMFTSRAEHRLALRSDNADVRLTSIGREIGLVDAARWSRFCAKRRVHEALAHWLTAQRKDGRPLHDWLKRPDVCPLALIEEAGWPEVAAGLRAARPELTAGLLADAVETALHDIRYEGYLRRQATDVERMAAMDARRLSANLNYQAVPGLRAEAREKLSSVRPLSVGQARRVSGITPADIAVLLLSLDRGGNW